MEDVTVQAVNYYFSLLLSKTKHAIAVKNYGNTKSLYAIAEERLKLGSITHDELLQLRAHAQRQPGDQRYLAGRA